ncbi:MAG: phage major capsid protein [Candidatus Hodarchaeota archaeon]
MADIKKALSTAGDLRIDDVDGGYLPKPIADEIVAYITENNYCRQLFRGIEMKAKTLDIPVITSGRSTVGQGVYYVPTQVDISGKSDQVGPKLHSVRLTAKKLMAYANVDEDDIEDATLDVVDLLLTSFAEAFAEAEEQAMLIGDTTFATADSPRKAWDGLLTMAVAAGLTVDQAISVSGLEVSNIEEAISLGIKKLGKYGRNKGKLVCFLDSGLTEALRRSKRLVNLYQLIGVRQGAEGEAVKVYGVKLLESTYLDGAIAGKTGVGIIVPKDEPIIGDRRKIKIKSRELIEHDKRRYVISERLDFNVRHKAYSSGVAGNAEAVVALRFTGSLT